MEKKIKVLIVPDVHGRDFWREPVMETLKETDAKVCFLGDYVDPYPHEWENPLTHESKCDYRQKAYDTFKEILELKKEYEDRIILLLGNHDCGYINEDICSCRRDRYRAKEIQNLIEDNCKDFLLAYEETIGGKHFIFSHAGINKEYGEFCFGDKVNENNVVDYFNNAWLTRNYGIMDSLGMYDRYRGWGGRRYASLIWADAAEWVYDNQEAYGISIIGHTQVKIPYCYKDKFYFTDAKRCSYLDDEGNIRIYKTDEIVDSTVPPPDDEDIW